MTDPDLSLFASQGPLADRIRPRTLDQFVGQAHLLGPGKALGDSIRRGDIGSVIFWGPPGSGKTSLARLIAQHTGREFVGFSAVTEGVPRVREIIKEAEQRLLLGRGTILFCDEIHRFNRAQQDAFLPHVERGTITLIGATTENPSFSLTGALLSRCRVYVLEPLGRNDLILLLRRALTDPERGLAGARVEVDDAALDTIAERSDGDARQALSVLEAAAQHVGLGGRVSVETLTGVFGRRVPRYDQAGEEHFNMLSAYHKSLRGSDPQAALYWMARMIEGGEDPRILFRRAQAMAAEDFGLADPNALLLAVAARQAFEALGAPEGYLPLAEMTIYLATAPKSNSTVVALGAALEAAQATPAEPVPLQIRNAPTPLMKQLGYGKDYQYAHHGPEHYIPQEYLPPSLSGSEFYRPGTQGFEVKIAERLKRWREMGKGKGEKGTAAGWTESPASGSHSGPPREPGPDAE
jgi:putative ATPase